MVLMKPKILVTRKISDIAEKYLEEKFDYVIVSKMYDHIFFQLIDSLSLAWEWPLPSKWLDQ